MSRDGYDVEHLRFVGMAAGLGFVLTPLFALFAVSVSGVTDVSSLYGVGAATVAMGLVVLAIPWVRLPPVLFHLLPPIACLLCTWAVASAEPHANVLVWTFLFVGPLVGFAFDDRRAVAAHLAFLSACMLVPVVSGAGDPPTEGAVLIGLPLLWVLSGIVAVLRAAEVRKAELLRDQVRSDPLTGVGNRRLLGERLEYEIKRHHRSGRSLALFALDLDRFKTVNDELGHPAGDIVLREAAAALTAAVRESDTVARPGGDEFAVLVPEADPGGLGAIAGALHAALGQVEAAGEPLTAAIGWASYPADAQDVDALVAAADAHQLRAKRDAGGYRTRTTGPVSAPARTR